MVRLGDLDLDQREAAGVVLSRIRKAATQVCRGGPAASPDLYGRTEAFRRCRVEAVSRALNQLDAPQVRQAYEARGVRLTQLADR